MVGSNNQICVEVPRRNKHLILTALLLLFNIIGFWDVYADRLFDNFSVIIAIHLLVTLLLFLWTLKYSVHYRLCPEGIVVLILSVKVRTIPWSHIAHAEYIHTWLRPMNRLWGDIAHGQIIYVALRGCPAYYSSFEMRWWHNFKHPFRALTIWLPEGNVLRYIEAFRGYFSDLKEQT